MHPKIMAASNCVASRAALEQILADSPLAPLIIAADWQGLEAVAEIEPDVVIVDGRSSSSRTFEEHLRQLRRHYQGPLIVLGNDKTRTAEYLEAGADYYLCRPLTGGYLLAHITRLLNRSVGESLAFSIPMMGSHES